MGKHTIKRAPPVHRNCIDCGVGFIAQNNEVAKGRGLFCSEKCRGRSQSKPLPSGTCQKCGTSFTAKYRCQKSRKYCSRECSAAAHRGKTKKFNPGRPYKHEKWMLAVLNRDLKCVECGVVHGLQAHHIKSWKSHPELRDDIENGETLVRPQVQRETEKSKGSNAEATSMRTYKGIEYANCDNFTDDEMEVIATWEHANEDKKRAICEKHGWKPTELYRGDLRATGGIKGPVFYVHVRLADVDRTLEWREVQAESLSDAIKVAERMPDVEVCLESSVVPGGVVT